MNTIDYIRADDNTIDAQQRDDGNIEVVYREIQVDDLIYKEGFKIYSEKMLSDNQPHIIQKSEHGDLKPEMFKFNKLVHTWLHTGKTRRKYSKKSNDE